ncbi:hypothetical protein EVAR_59312_1 [Eumeta japonica]|uniref:Uncharacterized protein n=1 Tax=Eumeta variegata TaxID=151549 RepID=A0A4C1Y9A2_EUMVA|nr:hypothetical protein EVAR_59312_1 [Eumeta japonica]
MTSHALGFVRELSARLRPRRRGVHAEPLEGPRAALASRLRVSLHLNYTRPGHKYDTYSRSLERKRVEGEKFDDRKSRPPRVPAPPALDCTRAGRG